MAMKVLKNASNLATYGFDAEINPEHLNDTPESLIPLIELIESPDTRIGQDIGTRISYWMSIDPTPEEILSPEWRSIDNRPLFAGFDIGYKGENFAVYRRL